jgi:serine phosphatase RsbU (regulator of sigma subunit)/tetratricopeptide (TPR) repeat protein
MKVKLIYILLLSLFSKSIVAQANLDSLYSVWNDVNDSDSNRLRAMDDFIWYGYLYSDPDSAYYYADKMYHFAVQSDNKAYLSTAVGLKGSSFFMRGQYELALENYYEKLAIDLANKDAVNIAKSHNNLGSVFMRQSNYPKSLEHFFESMKGYEKLENKNAVSSVMNNIGTIYQAQKDLKLAMEYYESCLVIKEEINDVNGIAMANGNIGLLYMDMKDLDASLEYQLKCLKLYNETNNEYGISLAYNDLGIVYSQMEEYELAIANYNRSLIYRIKIGDNEGLSETYMLLSNAYRASDEDMKALEYAQKSLSSAEKIDSPIRLKDASLAMYEAYKLKKDFKNALKMYEDFNEIEDSIKSVENSKAILQTQFKYEYDKKVAADSIVQEEASKLKQAESERQKLLLDKQKILTKSEQDSKSSLYIMIVLLGLFGMFLALFGVFMYNRFKVTQKQKNVINKQHLELEATHQEISDSINYAKRLQLAILPSRDSLNRNLGEGFVYYKPKGVVSGDFYWMQRVNETVFFAAADCTGHGVPGAMVSVVCSNALNRSVKEFKCATPASILDKTRELVVETFARSGEEIKDGMDISICAIHKSNMVYSGANNPIWIIRETDKVSNDHMEQKGTMVLDGKTLIEFRPNKQPVGLYTAMTPFNETNIKVEKGDKLYLFTDGFADQFGGEFGKKYKYGPMKSFLLSICENKMEDQQVLLAEEFSRWQGDQEQVDDICIIGVAAETI